MQVNRFIIPLRDFLFFHRAPYTTQNRSLRPEDGPPKARSEGQRPLIPNCRLDPVVTLSNAHGYAPEKEQTLSLFVVTGTRGYVGE
ncbi:MAG: hypothetical protein JWL77_1340 [Chthonomonadaceae bacterium]|nr:hypothetical protein [Chthonomonadaceae bacterium]